MATDARASLCVSYIRDIERVTPRRRSRIEFANFSVLVRGVAMLGGLTAVLIVYLGGDGFYGTREMLWGGCGA